ncbi:MAG: M23 family metallopeptidase [Candidatus Binatia bacterium]
MMLNLPVLYCAMLTLSLLAGCASQTMAPPTRKAHGILHVVKPGENLFRIGKAYDVSFEELARVNRLRDAHRIRAGQKIFIPRAGRRLPVEIITPREAKFESPGNSEAPEPVSDGFVWPVSGTVNSRFGLRGTTVHDGIDIAAPEGTPIRAVEAGEIIYSDQLRGYGNLVIVRHAGGFASVYAHNQVNLVREGQTVSRGEIIAKVGSTGRVTGPHLHFEIRKNNVAQDPLLHFPEFSHNP